ncbi:MAG: hypothetical protein WHV66_03940 [Anaerolineales bacterium]
MKIIRANNWLLFTTILLLSIGYLARVPVVPFHPDEQTQLFMSGDLERFFANPTDLFWNPEREQDVRQQYRELDAPITRLLLGLGRQLVRLSAPTVDWDWTKDWQYNERAGAVPSQQLLVTGRLSVAFLFPISLLLIFQIGYALGGKPIAWLTMLSLASNALVLLHTRRAMAESTLLFTSILTLWTLQRFRQNTYLLAIPAALAFNAKQSNAPLALICLIAILFPLFEKKPLLRKRLLQVALFLFIFVAITVILNPFLWSDPWKAAQAAWLARKDLVQRQATVLALGNPHLVWETIPERILGLFIHLFLSPPAIGDVANYLEQTRISEIIYFSNPMTWISRGLIAGTIMAILTFYGFIVAPLRARLTDLSARRYTLLLWMGTLIQIAVQVYLIPLPFQRYVMPLVPFACIWLAFGLHSLGRLGLALLKKATQP